MGNGEWAIFHKECRHPEPVEGEFVNLCYNLTFALQLSHSIKVVRQILILFVEVRILVGQRQKTNEIINLLVEGINEGKTNEIPITILLNEKDAIIHAYKNAKPGSFITIMCDVIPDALGFIKNLKEEEENLNPVTA